MTGEERKRLAVMLDSVMAIYHKPPLDDAVMKLYLRALDGFSFQAVDRALAEYVGTGKFAPNPADIIERIQGSSDERSELAWLELLKGVQRVGSYGSITFDNPAMHYAIGYCGGWPDLAAGIQGPQDTRKESFKAAYRRGERVAHWGNTPRWLKGQHAINNAGRNWKPAIFTPDGKRLSEVAERMLYDDTYDDNGRGILPKGGGLRGVADISGVSREQGQGFTESHLEGNGDAGRG